MHGGATGSGAQRELLEFKRSVRELLRESAAKLELIGKLEF